MPLNVLIVGAGICGPTLAILLQRSNPENRITVVERSPSLRVAGQQIDLKDMGPHILRQMGLLDEIRSRCVNETGFEMVDSQGNQIALFGVSAAGQRRTSMTSEHEIMRGDMVQVLYDANIKQNEELGGADGKGVTYMFGKTITTLDQSADGVDVTFSDGQTEHYDLVVGADGQGSHTRRLAFGQEVSDAAFTSLGIHGAYYSIPRIEGEGTVAKGHIAPGKRMAFTRTNDRPVTGAVLFKMTDSEKLKESYNKSAEHQKEAFAQEFEDFDWQPDRLIGELRKSDDFYSHEIGQIKMDTLSTGRVVLLGDAGYCASTFSGMGTNICLVGAYVLAGELARQSDNIAEALKSYEEKMRPFINECQQLSPFGFLFTSTRFGIWSMHQLIWVVSKIFNFMSFQSQEEDTHWKRLPVYPELNLPSFEE